MENNWNLENRGCFFWVEIDGLWVIKLSINIFFLTTTNWYVRSTIANHGFFLQEKGGSRQYDRKPCAILRIDMDYRSTATNRATHPVVLETERCFQQPYAPIMYYTKTIHQNYTCQYNQ